MKEAEAVVVEAVEAVEAVEEPTGILVWLGPWAASALRVELPA